LNKEVTVRFGKLKMQLWGETASGGCSADQGSSEPVAPRIYLFIKESVVTHPLKLPTTPSHLQKSLHPAVNSCL
jgi:hypothetical protein